MITSDINIRDPYILLHNGKYYLYGTRSETCWSEADGFDCYVGDDLENWDGPIEIFHKPEGFFADREYWAPECIAYNGKFYLVTTFGAQGVKKGTYILESEKPEGPFKVYSERITPEDWACIDATVYVEDDVPYLIFSHTLEDVPDGDVCIMELTKDLKAAAGEPKTIFAAKDTPWAKAIPFGKEEFGIDGPAYFSDGPCVFKTKDNTMWMTWSSWGTAGYAVGLAKSLTGKVLGPWEQVPEPIWPENGGHGMVFKDKEGTLRFTLHFPNDKYAERPVFAKFMEDEGKLKLIR